MSNILITGGAGFIGSHLVNSLIKNNHRVLVIDNLSKGTKKNLNTKAYFKKVDIRDKKRLSEVFRRFKPDYVFHLAAISSVLSKDTQEMVDVNVTGTMNVLEASLSSKAKRIIFSSSAAVYGNALALPTDENQKLRPIGEYGASKVEAESKIISFSKKNRLNYTILRFSNVYGPGQRYDNEGGVVSIFCNKIVASKPIKIYGTGEQTRDFVYVDDITDNYSFFIKKTQINIIANISTAKEVKINKLLKLVENISHKKANTIQKPAREGEIDRSCLDHSFAKKHLRWQPSTSILQGVKNTYQSIKFDQNSTNI